jgi:cytochrome b pre-mRNA-processing protein 3
MLAGGPPSRPLGATRGTTIMLAFLQARTARRRTARELYGAVVAQARRSEFYADCGVSDTLEGRYEMIVAHLYLLLDRLQGEGEAGAELSRAVSEIFVAETDTELREMGVGDLAVPRKVKRAAAGLFERSVQYRAALAADDGALLARFLAEIVPEAGADGLADYMRRASASLKAVPAESLLSGRVAFPDPILPRQGET